ncbi:hypothetical protein [Stenotrophomonas sp. PD6]|uniref:hypothetical protein n=1 Tax=Stenotrophomonas sp. PD6 TaxID=3368612 RepID=UPI003B9E8EB4
MNIFTHPPSRPYRNLFVAALGGVPAGSLVVSLYIALFESSSLAQAFTIVADALPVSFLGYVVMAPLLLLYGFPALWLTLRFRLAGPAIALAIAMLPALCILVSEGAGDDAISWLPLAISLATGVAFVAMAYRGAAQPHQFRMG